MQEANGQQLDKNPPTAGKDEVVSKLSKSNKGSSINISKWHPWFLLKGNKRFNWTYFLNTRWKLPLYYSIARSRPSPSIYHYILQITKSFRMMKHLFKSRKDYSNIKLTDTQQLAWVNRINPSYPCSKLQQIHQSIQMSPTDKLTHLACSIKQSSHKIITTSTYIILSSKVLISLLNWSRYSSLAKYMLI